MRILHVVFLRPFLVVIHTAIHDPATLGRTYRYVKALCFRGYGKQSAPEEDYRASRGRSLGNWRPTIARGAMPRLRGVPELNDSASRGVGVFPPLSFLLSFSRRISPEIPCPLNEVSARCSQGTRWNLLQRPYETIHLVRREIKKRGMKTRGTTLMSYKQSQRMLQQ